MGRAKFKQNFQDWMTQQWVILFGKKISDKNYQWLLGSFGKPKVVGLKLIEQIARDEGLEIDDSRASNGLIESFDQLNLSQEQLDLLSDDVVHFYESTSQYDLDLSVHWSPLFKIFGWILRIMFSNRIEQLNLPVKNGKVSKVLKSELINLVDKQTKDIKRTIWLRTEEATGNVIYSGVYETCTIPSGINCIKAVFPLPNGNATVIFKPEVGEEGELILNSQGEMHGDSGFYFLLNDSKSNLWSKYVRSFKEQLVVKSVDNKILAVQNLKLWNLEVVTFRYTIKQC